MEYTSGMVQRPFLLTCCTQLLWRECQDSEDPFQVLISTLTLPLEVGQGVIRHWPDQAMTLRWMRQTEPTPHIYSMRPELLLHLLQD
jgi:hypothetical protein